MTYLHSVWCVSVLKDHGLLDLLVVSLQLVHIRLEGHDLLLDALELVEMIFKGTLLHANGSNSVQVPLDPLTNHVGFLCELPTKTLVVLLADHLLLQRGVALWYQLLHLRPLVSNILKKQAKSKLFELQIGGQAFQSLPFYVVCCRSFLKWNCGPHNSLFEGLSKLQWDCWWVDMWHQATCSRNGALLIYLEHHAYAQN